MKKRFWFRYNDEKIESTVFQNPARRRVSPSYKGSNLTDTSKNWNLESVSNKRFSFKDFGKREKFSFKISDKTLIKNNG